MSENDTVNHKVVEQLCYLFTSSSTIKHLYLDKTKIILKSLKRLLNSIKDSLKVRTISVKGCNMNLKGEFGQEIVELIKENISLTDLQYKKNPFDNEFMNAINEELELNKQIVKNIFP